MAFWQLCNARGKNKKIQLYLFYKKTKDCFLHLVKISILFVFEQTTLPCSAKSTHLCRLLHRFLELPGAVPIIWHSLAKAPTLTITSHFSLKVTADVAGKGRRQTETNDTKTPKHLIKWDRVDTFHICCWITNRWKQAGMCLNLIKTILKTSNSNRLWSLPENVEFNECVRLEVTLSLSHFSKIKPLLQFAATDSKLKTQGKRDCAGSQLFSVHIKLHFMNSTSGTHKALSSWNHNPPQ